MIFKLGMSAEQQMEALEWFLEASHADRRCEVPQTESRCERT